jgi:uncharacterized protein
MFQTRTKVQAQKADKYIKTLAKHFAKKVTVENGEGFSKVLFPMGTCQMTLDNNTISFLCEALQEDDLSTVKNIISTHIVMLKELKDASLEWHDGTPSEI